MRFTPYLAAIVSAWPGLTLAQATAASVNKGTTFTLELVLALGTALLAVGAFVQKSRQMEKSLEEASKERRLLSDTATKIEKDIIQMGNRATEHGLAEVATSVAQAMIMMGGVAERLERSQEALETRLRECERNADQTTAAFRELAKAAGNADEMYRQLNAMERRIDRLER